MLNKPLFLELANNNNTQHHAVCIFIEKKTFTVGSLVSVCTMTSVGVHTCSACATIQTRVDETLTRHDG